MNKQRRFVIEGISLVNLRKDVTDRVETVKDTLRRDEVEIEKVPGEKTTAATTTPVMPASSPKI